jgi:peroxiredoxin/mono/diheme cytochrome c family protein
MMRARCRLLLPLLFAALLPGRGPTAPAEQPSTARLNQKINDFTLTDPAGKPVSLHGLKDRKAVVVVFLSFECPVANSYTPVLADLHRAYADKGVAFLGINSTEDLDAKQLADKAKEFRLPFPVLKDRDFAAVDVFQAGHTPEAFVLDAGFVLRYRGRIDDSYYQRLKKKDKTTDDLKWALDAVLAGQPVKTPATLPIGCPIAREAPPARDGKVTFHRDVLPILQNHCQQCHRPGEVGPFPLLTYKQAVNWASDVKEYTRDRKMPPWKPVEGPAFHNERKLSDRDIATLAAWADGGTPEGDPKDAPPAKKFVDGWHLGKPDLVLTVPEEMTIGASGRDLFRVVVLPTGLTEDRYVVAIEVRPGNNRVLHHTLNFFDRSGQSRKLEQKEKERAKKPDEQDAGPGYTAAMGLGFRPANPSDVGGLGGWAPGQLGRQLPEGVGYLLPKGADVVVQLHYHRTGRVEKDRTSIGLYFAKKPVEKQFQSAVLPGRFFFIPANEERFAVHGGIELQHDCRLYSVMPHMHMLGREIKVTVTPPEGKPFTLVAIKDWDYNWQETYFLREPLDLKKGTKVVVEAFYNNSEKNPSNPFKPPRPVIFGEQTDNEMCFVFLGCTSDVPGTRVKQRFFDPTQPAGDKK